MPSGDQTGAIWRPLGEGEPGRGAALHIINPDVGARLAATASGDRHRDAAPIWRECEIAESGRLADRAPVLTRGSHPQ